MNRKELAYQPDLDDKADVNHTHAASDITSGVLPLIYGGTGVTSISALKTALGISTASVRLRSAYFYIQDLAPGSSTTVTASFTIGYAVVSNPAGSPGAVSRVTLTNNSAGFASISGSTIRIRNTTTLSVAYDYQVWCIGI